jgi:hypothetical protein
VPRRFPLVASAVAGAQNLTHLITLCNSTSSSSALDYGRHGLVQPTLYCFNLAATAAAGVAGGDTLAWEWPLPSHIAGLGSTLIDMTISSDGLWVYIADASVTRGQPGIIVLDVKRHRARRVLHNSDFVRGKHYAMIMNGRVLRHAWADTAPLTTAAGAVAAAANVAFDLFAHPVLKSAHTDAVAAASAGGSGGSGGGGDTAAAMRALHAARPFLPVRPHLLTIALAYDDGSIIFKAGADEILWQVSTKYLKDWSWDDHKIDSMKQKLYPLGFTNGITRADDGGFISTDVLHSALVLYSPRQRVYRNWLLLRDEKLLRWPDGICHGPNDYVYVAPSALHLLLGGEFLEGKADVAAHAPFHLLRTRPREAPNLLVEGIGRPGQ